MKSIISRLETLEKNTPKRVTLLVEYKGEEKEMSIPEYLNLPEVKEYEFPKFEVSRTAYNKLSLMAITELSMLSDKIFKEGYLNHPAPNRKIEDYE